MSETKQSNPQSERRCEMNQKDRIQTAAYIAPLINQGYTLETMENTARNQLLRDENEALKTENEALREAIKLLHTTGEKALNYNSPVLLIDLDNAIESTKTLLTPAKG